MQATGDDPTRGLGEGRARVLIADDNEANLRAATRQLERAGVDVAPVANGAEALDLLASEPFDLVFLDGLMPGMDGPSTAREVRRREAGLGGTRITVVALTASVLPEDRERMLAAGMDDVVTKPIDPAELERALARWLPATAGRRTTVIPPLGPSEPAAAAGGDGPLVDEAVFGRLASLGDSAFVERMVRLFLADAAGRVSQAEEAMEARDQEGLRVAIESLESICGTVGAVALRREAELLDDDPAGHDADELFATLEATQARLDELLAAPAR